MEEYQEVTAGSEGNGFWLFVLGSGRKESIQVSDWLHSAVAQRNGWDSRFQGR